MNGVYVTKTVISGFRRKKYKKITSIYLRFSEVKVEREKGKEINTF